MDTDPIHTLTDAEIRDLIDGWQSGPRPHHQDWANLFARLDAAEDDIARITDLLHAHTAHLDALHYLGL